MRPSSGGRRTSGRMTNRSTTRADECADDDGHDECCEERDVPVEERHAALRPPQADEEAEGADLALRDRQRARCT